MILTILAIILVISISRASRETREYNRRMQEREEERHAILMQLMNRYAQQQDIRLYIEENEVSR